MRAQRRRAAGPPEDACPGDGRRGPRALGDATWQELAWAAVREGLETRTLGERWR
jgi:hypothetical protein